MAKFLVNLSETLSRTVEIDAFDAEEARQIAEKDYYENRIVLDSSDFFDARFVCLGKLERKTFVISYFENGNPDRITEVVYLTQTDVYDYYDELNTDPNLHGLVAPIEIPEQIINYTGGGTFSLCSYDVAAEYEPEWAWSHKYLWENEEL